MNTQGNESKPGGPEGAREFAGKTALIVGASRGIGAATARVFAHAGANVVVASRNEAVLESLATELRAARVEALAVRADVCEAADVEALVQKTLAKFGRLDFAFNNAGGSHPLRPLADLTVDEIDRAIALNLRGTLLAMKYEVAAMIANGGGAIVNMASTAGVRGVDCLSVYSATKHAVIGATKCVALEVAAKNIRVNVVAPGPILNDAMSSLTEEQRVPIARSVPLGRIGRGEDVGEAVLWLCSARAAFVTGVTLPIDGGQLAGVLRGR